MSAKGGLLVPCFLAVVCFGGVEMKSKGRLALPCVLAAVLLVALAIPWAEAQVDAWVDREEAKAAQSWRRSP